MELFDAHTVVMSAVLLVHILGVVILAVSAVALMTSSFAVVLAVRGVRSTWAMTRSTGSRGRVISPLSKRARSY
jgi:hypothetical protein